MSISKFQKCVSIMLVCASSSLAVFCQSGAEKITYKKIQVQNVGQRNIINWLISAGDTANYFELQKSEDGKIFKTIMLVLGANPADASGCSYECFDKQKPGIVKYYYRLKHVDVYGNENISETKMIAIN